ncbi:YceI family protein [Marinibaculum pumilum]|uniref:YceI family protein n=1 Tax=Marinibaculum pumilum TaxID=1766165 RepID=A0ABV7L763_9PROT
MLRAVLLAAGILAAPVLPASLPSASAAELATDRVYHLIPGDSDITFSVEEWGGLRTTEGRFATFSGLIALDEGAQLSGRVELEIDAGSVEVAGAEEERAWREQELRGVDFFDADRFPSIRFVSRRLERLDGRHARLHGDLTIRGVTRPADFAILLWTETAPGATAPRLKFSASGAIDRSGFGMTAWQDVLGREVQLSISGSAEPGLQVPPAGLL